VQILTRKGLAMMALMIALAAPGWAIEGTPGHVVVEVQTDAGAWQPLGQLAYNLHQSRQTLAFPTALLPLGPVLHLRLIQKDNDETQYDYLALQADGRPVAADSLRCAESGASLVKKLAVVDRDVAEMHGQTLLGVWELPKGAKTLTLVLDARSALTADIPALPFHLQAQGEGDKAVPYPLSRSEGSRLRFTTGTLKTGSGHPEGPVLVDMKVKQGRLKGRLDFGPDNDPGDDDYASLLAYDSQGKPTEFKIAATGSKWGKSAWAYSDLVTWQHMTFDFDIPLKALPRSAKGGMDLSFLAYGTCGQGPVTADVAISGLSASSVAVGQVCSITVTSTLLSQSGTNAGNYSESVTVQVLDSVGNTVVNTQQTSTWAQGGTCAMGNVYVHFTPACGGTYTVFANAVGVPDTDTTNGNATTTMLITGGPPCAIPAYQASNLGKTIAAPVPAKAGQPICLYYDSAPTASHWSVYNVAGDLVASLDFTTEPSQCWDTARASVAPGVYWIRVQLTTAGGGQRTEVKRVVVTQ
jgi:hypothetical protein